MCYFWVYGMDVRNQTNIFLEQPLKEIDDIQQRQGYY